MGEGHVLVERVWRTKDCHLSALSAAILAPSYGSVAPKSATFPSPMCIMTSKFPFPARAKDRFTYSPFVQGSMRRDDQRLAKRAIMSHHLLHTLRRGRGF